MDKLDTLLACLPESPYKTTFTEEIASLRQQLAAALVACDQYRGIVHVATNILERTGNLDDANRLDQMLIAIQPDASALKAHDAALIEKIAQHMDDSGIGGEYLAGVIAKVIRELKGTL